MTSESRLFSISSTSEKLIRNFRLKGAKSGIHYLSWSIERDDHEVVPEEDGPVTISSIEELVDELPDNTPRYVILSYEMTHGDGRKSTPLVFIYWIPRTSSIAMSTLYASAKVWFIEKCDLSKVIEIRDADDLTTETVEDRLR